MRRRDESNISRQVHSLLPSQLEASSMSSKSSADGRFSAKAVSSESRRRAGLASEFAAQNDAAQDMERPGGRILLPLKQTEAGEVLGIVRSMP